MSDPTLEDLQKLEGQLYEELKKLQAPCDDARTRWSEAYRKVQEFEDRKKLREEILAELQAEKKTP